MRRRFARTALGCALSCAGAVAVGCFGKGPELIDTSDSVEGGSLDLNDGSFVRMDVDLGDSFALDGVQPSHGPFTGGTRVVLGGRGFTSKLRVFVGANEVPPGSFLASDPTRAAIETPPGPPGAVDVRIRDDASGKERVLPGGFSYDPFVVTPSSGATSGGTRIRITNGDQTSWVVNGAVPTVQIDGHDCTNVSAVSGASQAIECTTAPDGPGSKDVVVVTPGGTRIQVRDAYTYSDSPDGYRGGLTGSALAGKLHVLAFDSLTGTPLPGAYAIAGDVSPMIQQTGSSGVAELQGIAGASVTVTVAAKCHQPITFVGVPVDTVTAYLAPVFDPRCAMGDPPSTGGNGGLYGGVIEGQLVFPGANEFQRADWTTVPPPTKPTERRAAYVFEASSSPSGDFQLPSPDQATTPDDDGMVGYPYSVVTYPGNATIYAVAGLEDRSNNPPTFVPYAMGVARGITVPSQTRVTGVDLKMDILFDHEIDVVP
ncbi:MAG TPA: IPT/TIG domain-containing protein, partial [Labilithrix sp.]